MNNLSNSVSAGLIHSYQDFGRRVRALADPLTEEQFWTNPYGYGNSVGNLVLHLTGNLNYYIGARIAGTGYVRERDLEFTSRLDGRKEEVLNGLDEVVALVVATLKSQTAEDWTREYSAAGLTDVRDRFDAFVRCASHFHHHIGQMIYLTKELAK
ncbi:MAG: DinB family protein [Blastocatellia bacterium]